MKVAHCRVAESGIQKVGWITQKLRCAKLGHAAEKLVIESFWSGLY